MKKHLTKLLLLPLVAMALLFSSCERDVHMKTVYFKVNPQSWSPQNTLGYVYCTCAMPEITPQVIERGAVLAYFIDGNDFDNPLPYLLPYYLDQDGDGIGDEGPFFENIRYSLEPGKITFIIQQNDNAIEYPRDPMQFKVSVLF